MTDDYKRGYAQAVEDAANRLEPKNPRSDWTEYAKDRHDLAKDIRALAPSTPAPVTVQEATSADPCAPLERAVLCALPGQERHPNFGFDYFSCLQVIADDAGVDKDAARFACRRLRDKGLALFQAGLFTEDGEPAGAGYALTDAGRAALAEMENTDDQ